MTIDISNLSQEKQALLKARPDLLKSLEQTIPRQIQKVERRRKKLSKTKSKFQRDLDEIDERTQEVRAKAAKLRKRFERLKREGKSKHQKEMAVLKARLREYEFKLDPILRKIQRRLDSKVVGSTSSLVCPVCGEGDRGNIMNGKPWCFKCGVPLVKAGKVLKWLKRIRVVDDKFGVKQ